MENGGSDREKYLKAKARVEAIKGFYIHLTVFLCVIAGLAAADYAGGGDWWVQWPFLGWGLGVLGHAYLVFSSHSDTVRNWEERKIQQHLAKM